MYAAGKNESVIVGRIKCKGLSYNATGKIFNFKQKIFIKSAPIKKFGREIPIVIKMMKMEPINFLLYTADPIPKTNPAGIEISKAKIPSVNETGNAENKISLTERFIYFNDGPRSPYANPLI